MFKDCEFAAIISTDSEKELRYVPLSRDLQDSIKEEWESQYISFFEEVVGEVNYEPGYKPGKDELFCLRDYELPDWLVEEDSASISDFEPIRNNETQISLIKGIAAFVQNENDEDFILFQRFMPAQVIRPRLSFIWDRDTFKKMDGPGFRFANYLSAVYNYSERKLLFRSYYNVDMFLSLSDYFRPATEKEIREILNDELFAPENIEVLATNPSYHARTKFAQLKQSGVLDNYTASEIADSAKSIGFPIQLSENGKQIVFPSKKSDANELLRFLNDGYVRGILTETPYIANSKRKIDQ